MSYTSETVLPPNTTLVQVQDLVALLGYKKAKDNLKVPNHIAGYFWFDEIDYRSYVGVELDIDRDREGIITVTTRSRVGRSYWDLTQQNKTLKMFRDLLGGHFTTDAGRIAIGSQTNLFQRPYPRVVFMHAGVFITISVGYMST